MLINPPRTTYLKVRHLLSSALQFGEISNSVDSVSTGNCTFYGVSIPRALHGAAVPEIAWESPRIGQIYSAHLPSAQ